MLFEVVKTDIVNIVADAIVLPANSELKEGSGVSTALFAAAGRRKLTQACSKIGTREVGTAVPTLAYNLNAKYIVHAVVPKWIDGEQNEYNLLCSAYLSAMTVADYMGCESIAFPLLASGNNGFDLSLAFEIAEKSIECFDGSNLKKAILVVYTDDTANLIKEFGYSVLEIPNNLGKQALKAEHQAKFKELRDDAKEIALKFMENQIEKALRYLEDEENQEKVFEHARRIVKIVTAVTKKKKRK